MDGFSMEAVARMPLAVAALTALDWVFDDEFLNSVFERHRGRSYEKELTFSTMVALIQSALLEHNGSGRQSMLRTDENGGLEASYQAAYGKLRRIPVGLSLGFFAESCDRLREIYPGKAAISLPSSLRAFDVLVIDGKKIKKVAKRMKAARKYSGTPFGGKALVAMDLRRDLLTAMNAHVDGEKNDGPLVADLLQQVRQRGTRRRLWVADSQFCDLTQPPRFTDGNDAYLLRFHPKNSFERDSDAGTHQGTEARDRRYQEEWGWMGSANNKDRTYVRRITLSREDDDDVILVTSLLDAEQYPAVDLLETYLLRWGIEKAFQQVTEVFQLQTLISSTPEGTIFQFGFCMLLYNLIKIVQGYVAAAEQRSVETISTELLFYDVHRELISMSVMLDHETTMKAIQHSRPGTEIKARLESLLKHVWQDRWIKSPKKKIPKNTKPKMKVPGRHSSIYRMLNDAKNKPK